MSTSAVMEMPHTSLSRSSSHNSANSGSGSGNGSSSVCEKLFQRETAESPVLQPSIAVLQVLKQQPHSHQYPAQQQQPSSSEKDQFFSPRRKRMASMELVNSHHHHLNQSELTEPGNVSFQTVTSVGTAPPPSSSSSASSSIGMMTTNSASSVVTAVNDLSSDNSRLYVYGNAEALAMTQAHPSITQRQQYNHNTHNTSMTACNTSTSHVQQKLFLSPVRNTPARSRNNSVTASGQISNGCDVMTNAAALLASPAPSTGNNSASSTVYRPAALFSRTNDHLQAKKLGPTALAQQLGHNNTTHSSSGRNLARVRANIFGDENHGHDDSFVSSPRFQPRIRSHDEQDQGNEADLSTGGWATRIDDDYEESDSDMLDDDAEFLSRGGSNSFTHYGRVRGMEATRSSGQLDDSNCSDDVDDSVVSEHFDRLASESDSSMNHGNKKFPKHGHSSSLNNSANTSLLAMRIHSSRSRSRSHSSERASISDRSCRLSGLEHERDLPVPLSPVHSQTSVSGMSIQSQGSGFKTAVRRNSRPNVPQSQLPLQPPHTVMADSGHQQAFSDNFTRSCDLNATAREGRERDRDRHHHLEYDTMPCSPMKQPRRSETDFAGVTHQVLFPSSPSDALGVCTPVTEAGSPAVLDDRDIDYPEGGDDSMMVMNISHESIPNGNHRRRKSGSNHTHDVNRSLYSANSPVDQEMENYDAFAYNFISRPTPVHRLDLSSHTTTGVMTEGPDSVERPVSKVRRKSKIMDSPDGIHAVGDLSSTSLTTSTASVAAINGPPSASVTSTTSVTSLFGNSFDHGISHNNGPPSFVSDVSLTSSQGHNQHSLGSIVSTVSSQASNNKSNIARPLPDPAAFDNAVSTKVLNSSFEHHLSSPVCPATPSRTPAAWHGSSHTSNAAHHHLTDPSPSSASGIISVSSSSLMQLNESVNQNSDFFSMFIDNASADDGFLNTGNTLLLPPPRPPALTRQNSLHVNKLLVSAQGATPRGEVSFYRDFCIEGILGSGTFAEVYKVRSLSPFASSASHTLHEEENEDNDDHDDYGQAMAMSPATPVAHPFSSSSMSLSSAPQYFAVKRIKREFRSRKDRDWLLNEVLIMKQVNSSSSVPCPYVIPFIRAWQEDNHFFVQLGLAEKGTLKDLAHSFVTKKETFPTRTLWHVVHNIAAGLKHVHAANIVHLDIKPANILINSKGILQIGDFGMASTKGSRDDSHEGDTR